MVQLIPILSGQGFLISFLETLVFRFQSHRDYFHLQSTFLVMSRAGRGLETHREKVCLISDMEIPSLRVKEIFLNTLIPVSVSLRRVSVREAM